VPDPPALYLFDGSNLFHAGGYRDRRELVDRLASFLALQGARGVVVFDGSGTDGAVGSLEIRYAAHADSVLERLAAEHRGEAELVLVSSDATLRSAADLRVDKRGALRFLDELPDPEHRDTPATAHGDSAGSRLGDRLDDEVRARLERLRRGG
jgi:predicted RNA-binding protein with PIN domain